MSIHFARGPKTQDISEKDAIELLKSDPRFPKGAEVAVTPVAGHWLAAISEPPSFTRIAENPFEKKEEGGEEGPPKDDSPESVPDQGPEDSEGPDGPPSPDDGGDGSEGPPKHDEEKGGEHGGDKAMLHELLGIVTQMAQALGIAPPGGGPEESPIPGKDVAPPPPGGPDGGPPGLGGPPHGHGGPPPGGPAGPDQTVQHQRALKPGEAPPGTTPVGAPAFASVSDDHPWASQIGKSASFTVADVIPADMPMELVDRDLKRVAIGTPFKVKQIGETTNENGERVAQALISVY